jgi:hypothetical protein
VNVPGKKNVSNHRYSTYALLLIICALGVGIAMSVDGNGTQNYIAKWSGNTTLTNSSITDNGSVVNVTVPLYENGSRVCTLANGVCFMAGDGNNYTTSIDFTGTTTKTLNLARNGIANLTASFSDSDTTYTASSGLNLTGTSFSANATTCTSGQYSRYTGTGWSCFTDSTGGSGTVTSVSLSITNTTSVTVQNPTVTTSGVINLNFQNASSTLDGILRSVDFSLFLGYYNNISTINTTLQSNINAVQANLTSVNSTVSNLVTNNLTANANIATLNATMQGVIANLTSLNTTTVSTFGLVYTNFTNLNASYTGNLSGLYNNITALQGSNTSANANIATLNSTLISGVANIATLNMSLQAVMVNVTTVNATATGAVSVNNAQYLNITALQGSNTTIFSMLALLYTNVTNINATLQANINLVQANVTSVNATVAFLVANNITANANIATLNSTKALAGTVTCATGTFAQNVTMNALSAPSVQCYGATLSDTNLVRTNQTNTYTAGVQNFTLATDFILPQANDPGLSAGEIAFDSKDNQTQLGGGGDGVTRVIVSTICNEWLSTDLRTGATGTTEQNFTTKCTFPANYFKVNRTIRVTGYFRFNSSAAASSYTIRARINSSNTPAATSIGYESFSGTPGNSAAVDSATVSFNTRVVTSGSSGTFLTWANENWGTVAATLPTRSNAANFTRDTTVSNTMHWSVQYAATTAGNDMNFEGMTVEELY